MVNKYTEAHCTIDQKYNFEVHVNLAACVKRFNVRKQGEGKESEYCQAENRNSNNEPNERNGTVAIYSRALITSNLLAVINHKDTATARRCLPLKRALYVALRFTLYMGGSLNRHRGSFSKL